MNIQAYTDGACRENPGKGGYGAIVLANGNEMVRLNGGFRRTTNNRMEIFAAIHALEVIDERLRTEKRKDTDIKVTVFSDSQLVVKTMSDGWARNSNRDLWKRLDAAVDALGDGHGAKVEFVKVKGHADDRYNTIADALAVQASQYKATNLDDVYENISSFEEDHTQKAEPVVRNIRLLNDHLPARRKVEVDLSNGTTVSIEGYDNGFVQSGCTTKEASITVDIAWRFAGWLNGRPL